jgi:hypothetical protein
MDAKLKPRFILEAVIKRADGTIEDLGIIAGATKDDLGVRLVSAQEQLRIIKSNQEDVDNG